MLEWYRREWTVSRPARPRDSMAAWIGHLMCRRCGRACRGARRHVPAAHVGAGCPTGDLLSLGAFVGLSGFAQPATCCASGRRSWLDYQFVDMLTALRDDLSIPFDRLVVVGGAVE